MKKRMFTVELTYTVPYSATAIVMATSPEKACAEAMTDPPYDDFKPCLEGDGPTFVESLCEGAYGSVQSRPVAAPLLAVPAGYGEPHPAPQLHAFVALIARMSTREEHTPSDPDDAAETLDGLIARARALIELAK